MSSNMATSSFLEDIVFSTHTIMRPLKAFVRMATFTAGLAFLSTIYPACAPAEEKESIGCFFDSDCRGGRVCVSPNDQPLSARNLGKCVYGRKDAGRGYDMPSGVDAGDCRRDSDIDIQHACTDVDNDRFYKQEGCGTAIDPDDRNNTVYPGAPELCDYLDNNGDGQVDEGVTQQYFPDRDGDGFGDRSDMIEGCSQPRGYVNNRGDCDDQNEMINPLATELCDMLNTDENCNGETYEGCPCAEGQTQDCGETDVGECDYGIRTCTTDYRWGGCVGYIGPRREICNERDDNCDGETDEWVLLTFNRDADRDGFGDPLVSRLSCRQPVGYVADRSDCDDFDRNVNPDMSEVCNKKDDDCNEGIDEYVQQTFYADRDGDGYGGRERVWACEPHNGLVNNRDDCNDQDPLIFPGAEELCDGRDNNCDDFFDEGCQ